MRKWNGWHPVIAGVRGTFSPRQRLRQIDIDGPSARAKVTP
jgi:hypothetical protein